MMAELGVPLPVVQAMVGHMSSRIVRYYTHISNRAARTAVELLDNTRPASFVGNFAGKPEFVGNFVGKPESAEESPAKLLN